MGVPRGPFEYPNSPAELTDATAKNRTLQYERTYIRNALAGRNVSDVSLASYPVENRATISLRAANGYYLTVQHSVGYEVPHGYVDDSTRASYFVNTTEIRRLDGTRIDPPDRND